MCASVVFNSESNLRVIFKHTNSVRFLAQFVVRSASEILPTLSSMSNPVIALVVAVGEMRVKLSMTLFDLLKLPRVY